MAAPSLRLAVGDHECPRWSGIRRQPVSDVESRSRLCEKLHSGQIELLRETSRRMTVEAMLLSHESEG